MRKYLFILICLTALAFPAAARGVAERCERLFYRNQGIDREYYLFRPENMRPGSPLVLVLHGYGGSALQGKTRLMDLGEEHGFAVCYAQGIKDSRGKTYWNVGYPFHKDSRQDDVGYLCALVRHLQKTYGFSSSATFLTGMSNGGEMCYLMAMKKPEVFKAIASIAGLTLSDMDRNYRKPVPFMEVHGTADRTSRWEGDPGNEGGWGSYLAVPVSISYLIAADGCLFEKVDTLPVKRNPVIKHSYLGGSPSGKNGPECEVLLYEVQGGGHSWAEKDMDTCGEIWKFFSKYLDNSAER